jgi:hypothetical protein
MESPSTFGEWLGQRRNELHLTREHFAERVGAAMAVGYSVGVGFSNGNVKIALTPLAATV